VVGGNVSRVRTQVVITNRGLLERHCSGQVPTLIFQSGPRAKDIPDLVEVTMVFEDPLAVVKKPLGVV